MKGECAGQAKEEELELRFDWMTSLLIGGYRTYTNCRVGGQLWRQLMRMCTRRRKSQPTEGSRDYNRTYTGNDDHVEGWAKGDGL